MNVFELTNDDILRIIECIKVACKYRENCIDCPYADEYGCTLKCIPAKWRPEAIMKGGDNNDNQRSN